MRTVKTLTAVLAVLILPPGSFGQTESRLVANLKAGRPQTVVAYGTSLTDWGAWVDHLRQGLASNYPGLATVINSGRNDRCSRWGVENLEERVIGKKPDTVLIEFAINDARLDNGLTRDQARANLMNMIDRIRAADPETEIILMTMNPPVGLSYLRRPRIRDYYRMYREVAEERGLPLIDHARNWDRIRRTDPDLFDRYVPDGVHPGEEGCAAVITPAVLEALGLPPRPPRNGETSAGPAATASPLPRK